jgi:plasmid stabilization system protein ParE
MARVVFASEAREQLVALYHYIASAASPEIAASYTNGIVEQCESLAMFPLRGTARDAIRPGLRTFGFKRRVTIAFDVSGDLVTILGIFYGGQNFESVLED